MGNPRITDVTTLIADEQNAINLYKWYNLPDTLDSQLIERILYYKGYIGGKE